MIKYGKTKFGNQRYICRKCGKTRVENYIYQAYKSDINYNIIQLIKAGFFIQFHFYFFSFVSTPDTDFFA
ncbi:IS1/IS1595 family N-terminal zinc-binding domain-containing protein [Flavobacterium seoulense]